VLPQARSDSSIRQGFQERHRLITEAVIDEEATYSGRRGGLQNPSGRHADCRWYVLPFNAKPSGSITG